MTDPLNTPLWPDVRPVIHRQSSDTATLETRFENSWLIVYVHQGGLTLHTSASALNLMVGSCLLLRQSHTEQVRLTSQPDESSYDVFWFHLPADQIQVVHPDDPDTSSLLLRWPGVPSDKQTAEIQLALPRQHIIHSPVLRYQMAQFLNDAVAWSSAHDVYSQLLASLAALEVLVRLSSDFNQTVNPRPLPVQSPRVSEARVQQTITFLHENFNRKISGDELARHIGVHFDYLNRQFRRYTGQTIFVYLNHLRIQQACHLLQGNTNDLHEIATCSGFSDEYRFSKVFKQYIGMTPRRYQQMLSDQ